MADPTAKVRRGVMERDGGACCSCGDSGAMTFQHRQASGMGGNPVRPGYADGLAACGSCNSRFESDLQSQALALGWKVKRRIGSHTAADVPYFHAATGRWYRLAADGPWREQIPVHTAVRMMAAVYGPGGPNS